ncbi:hypothetical protein FRZ03_06380 [Streptomyces misionensis]|uniref:Uncharacterized protein n=1 Tax=Streptomyces misionensis TaxID=67331 RepID=A0A5C6JYL6_9ACTN|nr:hypothetical protein FRZ03_06380 [Streptomyces misionensis]
MGGGGPRGFPDGFVGGRVPRRERGRGRGGAAGADAARRQPLLGAGRVARGGHPDLRGAAVGAVRRAAPGRREGRPAPGVRGHRGAADVAVLAGGRGVTRAAHDERPEAPGEESAGPARAARHAGQMGRARRP